MPHPILAPPKNATQMNKPWEIVAFEELGGFENIGEERVVATSRFVEKTSATSR